MAPFRDIDRTRLDWRILSNGAVHLYCSRAYFSADAEWLRRSGYLINRVHCGDETGFRHQMAQACRFKAAYGFDGWSGNLDALRQALGDLDIWATAGTAFCFERFDALFHDNSVLARGVLDAIERQSRRHLLFGNRLLALVQTDDPDLDLGPLGARRSSWNRRESINAPVAAPA